MSHRSALRNAILCIVAVSACRDAPPPVVRVGQATFTENQLLGLTPTRRRTLAHLVAFGLAVADSSLTQLGEPLTRRWKDDRLLDILAAELTLEKHDIGEDVLEARYLSDPDYELTVRHVLFFSERWRGAAERSAARDRAEAALADLRKGADFAETAARMSEEPGAEARQGLLTPGREGAWVDEFWRAASQLEVGQISPVTETEYGYHILRLEDRAIVPFSESRSRVGREVADQIDDPAAVLEAWLDGASRSVELSDALGGLEAGSDPATVLATWTGDRILTLQDYLAASVSKPASWALGGLGTDPDAFRAEVVALARRSIALAEAHRRGLAVPMAEQEKVERRWEDLTYRWSASLGFHNGFTPDAVAEAALAALARTTQGATIVRAELDDRAPLLEDRYETRVLEAPSGSRR